MKNKINNNEQKTTKQWTNKYASFILIHANLCPLLTLTDRASTHAIAVEPADTIQVATPLL